MLRSTGLNFALSILACVCLSCGALSTGAQAMEFKQYYERKSSRPVLPPLEQETRLAIAMGGGVRVGLEDNIHFDRERRTLARNADLLKRIHTIAAANDRPLMLARELRDRLQLGAGMGNYGTRQIAELEPAGA